MQINLADNRFRHFTKSLEHKNILIAETLSVEQRNLTAVGISTKNRRNQKCVIRHGKLPEQKAAQKSINSCVGSAILQGGYLFKNVVELLKKAKLENNNVRQLIENCNTGYEYEVVNCAISVVSISKKFTFVENV